MKRVTVVNTQKNSEEQEMERTVAEKIIELKNWVEEKSEVFEIMLNTSRNHLDYYLNHKKKIDEDLFNNKFSCQYYDINENIEMMIRFAERNNIPEDILYEAINSLKQIKSKVRKVKAVYKEAFKELRENIKSSLEDEEFVKKNEELVRKIVKNWCSTNEIREILKGHFVGVQLLQTTLFIIKQAMESVANPNENEIMEFVEAYMESCSVKRDIA